jgi:hypothetical protein
MIYSTSSIEWYDFLSRLLENVFFYIGASPPYKNKGGRFYDKMNSTIVFKMEIFNIFGKIYF